MDNSIVQRKYVTNIAWAMFIQKYNECLLELNFTDCPIFHLATLVRLEFKTERFTIIEKKSNRRKDGNKKMDGIHKQEVTSN